MIRRASAAAGLAALLAALAGAPAAPAAPARVPTTARPAVGGASFNLAPVLRPGTYRDTLPAGGMLAYGVQLRPGQQLTVRVTAGGGAAAFRRLAGVVDVFTYGPLRTQFTGDEADGAVLEPGDVAEVVTPPAGTDEVTDGAVPDPGPGTFGFVLHSARPPAGAEPSPAGVPVRFTIEVTGEAGGSSVPAPAPTPAATAPAVARGGDGPGSLVLAGTGAAGALIGALGGVAAGRRRRARTAVDARRSGA